jgi:hypothetical protein
MKLKHYLALPWALAIVVAGVLWGLSVAGTITDDVAAADAFWADAGKSLAGAPPEFGVSTFYRDGEYGREAIWPIADSLGIVTTGQLRFVVRPGLQLGPSVSVIFNRQAIARLDFVPAQECEPNPMWAAVLGLPPIVCGPHLHGWEYNRNDVLRRERWELPAREPLPPQIRRFEQAFPWLADRINLSLTPDQRSFDVPAELV